MREGREALYTNLREGACVDVFAGHGVVGALGHVAVGVGPAVLQAVGAEAAALQKKRRKGGWAGGKGRGGEREGQAAMEIYNDATKNEEAGERKSRREKKRKPKGPETPSVPTPKSTSKRQKERKKKRQDGGTLHSVGSSARSSR